MTDQNDLISPENFSASYHYLKPKAYLITLPSNLAKKNHKFFYNLLNSRHIHLSNIERVWLIIMFQIMWSCNIWGILGKWIIHSFYCYSTIQTWVGSFWPYQTHSQPLHVYEIKWASIDCGWGELVLINIVVLRSCLLANFLSLSSPKPPTQLCSSIPTVNCIIYGLLCFN